MLYLIKLGYLTGLMKEAYDFKNIKVTDKFSKLVTNGNFFTELTLTYPKVVTPTGDPDFFSQLKVDEFGAICWPNGADLAPDAIHKKLKGGSGREEQKKKSLN